ncbi:DUF2752 domain-containing protein [Gordonia iterans]
MNAAGVADRSVATVQAVARHRVAGPAVILAGAAGVGAFVWFADPTTPGGIIPPCPTNALLHINCPGCGASRALYSLMHGDVPAALQYNALVIVAVGLLAAAFVTYALGLWRGRKVRGWQNLRWAPIAVLVLVSVWFVIRNIPVAPFDSLRV